MGAPRDSRASTGSSLKQRLRRWLQPPRKLRPTRAGWIFFAITFSVGFAAFNTGNNLLYLVLSLMLAFLVLSGVMSESALRGIRVRRRLPRDLFAREVASIGLELTNDQRRMSAFAVVVEDRVRETGAPMRAAGRAFALRIAPGTTELRSYRFAPSRRGSLEFVGFEVFTRFPFGLFSKSLSILDEVKTLVYPPIDPVAIPPNFGAARDPGEAISGPMGSGANAVGLREFDVGDSVRRIHWRSSLRHRQLLVTQIESEHRSEIEVRLKTRNVEAGEPFEARVSWAASEIVAMLDADNRVSLTTDGPRFAAGSGARHRARLLSFLALVEPERAGAPS
ncbi:MAG: DUF58 domain-containing protein [Myxococcota bacterium]